MPRKIKFKISFDNRPNLRNLFHDFLSRKRKEYEDDYDEDEYSAYLRLANGWDGFFDEDDYWNGGADDDFYSYLNRHHNNRCQVKELFPKSMKKRDFDQSLREDSFKQDKKGKKRGRKSKNKKQYLQDFVDDADVVYSKPKILFYNDYHNNFEKLAFFTYKDFKEFCDEKGYTVPQEVKDDIQYLSESHCCVNPVAMSLGVNEIMAESSYGEMFYSACNEDELGG